MRYSNMVFVRQLHHDFSSGTLCVTIRPSERAGMPVLSTCAWTSPGLTIKAFKLDELLGIKGPRLAATGCQSNRT